MAQTNPSPLTAREHCVSVEKQTVKEKAIKEQVVKWKASHHRLQTQLSAIEKACYSPSQDELQNLKAARSDTCILSAELQQRFEEWASQINPLSKYIALEDEVGYCETVTNIRNCEVEMVLKVNRSWYNRLRRSIRDYSDRVTERVAFVWRQHGVRVIIVQAPRPRKQCSISIIILGLRI
jgi:hypothetical protein